MYVETQASKQAPVYVLKCANDTYYTRNTHNLSERVWHHQEGVDPKAYTFRRRPLELVWNEEFATFHEALTIEHQIKGWSRAKKEALIRGDFDAIHEIVKEERKRREQVKRNISQ